MVDMTKEYSLAMAIRDFFGYRTGQTAMDFMGEMKALNADDKAEFKAGLIRTGYKIKD